MKTLSKRFLAFCGALLLVITSLQMPVEVQAASASTVKKAYVSYLKKQISKGNYASDINYQLYDFNKDGTKELVVFDNGGARRYYSVYTYKNKKVVLLISGVNEIGYIKGSKYLVAYGSGGAMNFDYVVYKMKNGKLVKVNKYACVNGKYKKNGKAITKAKFNSFAKKVITDLGTVQRIDSNYYSPEDLGFTIFNSGGTYTKITKVTNNKIYYYTYKLGNEQITTNKSKVKTAKITSKTEFYYGDTNLAFSNSALGTTFDTRKWILKISKKDFIEKMKTYQGSGDRIMVKNGKVEKVIFHIQVAG